MGEIRYMRRGGYRYELRLLQHGFPVTILGRMQLHLRVYLVVSGLPGSFSGFLWMGKIDLFGGMVTGMNLGFLNMI